VMSMLSFVCVIQGGWVPSWASMKFHGMSGPLTLTPESLSHNSCQIFLGGW
jgi:hypothetical protein